MDKTFMVNIMTPEKQFTEDDFEAVVFTGIDGEICILKDHMPMLAAVAMGVIRLKKDGEWKSLVSDDGFAEVNKNIVNIYVNMCEWAENVEAAKADLLRRKREEEESIRRYKINAIDLARTVYGFGKNNKKS